METFEARGYPTREEIQEKIAEKSFMYVDLDAEIKLIEEEDDGTQARS